MADKQKNLARLIDSGVVAVVRVPQVKLLPTGGVDATNAGEYIRAGAVAIGVGGKLVDRKLIAEGRFDVITENARQLLRAVAGARQQA